MAKKRSTSTSPSHPTEDEETMPSLSSSETSHSSPRGTTDLVQYHHQQGEEAADDEYRSSHSSDNHPKNEISDDDDDSIVRRRHTDASVLNRSHRSSRSNNRSSTISPPRRRSRSRGRDGHVRGSRSVSRARSKSRRQQHQHRSRSRARQKPTSSSTDIVLKDQNDAANNPPGSSTNFERGTGADKDKHQRRRFSYSRRQSLNGTTTYAHPHMATLDTYLRTTSGLRLQTDGTCNFIFENQKFVIETTEDTGDFLFYASFGPLQELQAKMNHPKQLLRLLAYWNEELKQRGMQRGGENHAHDMHQNDGEYEGGLLRIDSSKADTGPQVAFIYYGHMDEIRTAGHFQETLDDFVDDALEFSDRWRKLNGTTAGQRDHHAEPTPSLERGARSREHHDDSGSSLDRSNRSARGAGRSRSPLRSEIESRGPRHNRAASRSPLRSETENRGPTRHNNRDQSIRERDHASSSNHHNHGISKQQSFHKEGATSAAHIPSQEKSDNTISTSNQSTPSNTPSNTPTTIKPKSVLSKMISSLRNKSNQDSNISSMAFIDPTNPGCAFVVDKEALDANEGNGAIIKPTINLSRGGAQHPALLSNKQNKGGSFHNNSSAHLQKGRSFHEGDDHPINKKGRSFHDSGVDYPPKKGRSFHVVDNDEYSQLEGNLDRSQRSRRPLHRKGKSFHVGDDEPERRPHHRKATSFCVDDGRHGAPEPPGRPNRRSTSFTVDDYSGHKHFGPPPPPIKPQGSKSFHMDDSTSSHRKSSRHAESKVKSKSFHHADRRPKRNSLFDEYETSNESIDIYDKQGAGAGPHPSGGPRLNQSEPVGVVARQHDHHPEPPNNRRHTHSRRHSTMESQQHSSQRSSRRTMKRHSMQDEDDIRRARSKSRGRNSGRQPMRPGPPPPPPF